MRLLRIAGDILLWVLAVVGVLAGGLWVANAMNLVQPLVVVSGSMQPSIRTGDVLIALPRPAAELRVGDVATLPSSSSGTLVTHRVVSIDETDGTLHIRMMGDANDTVDSETYVVESAADVLRPTLTVPGAGYAVSTLALPGVWIPLLISLAALIVLTSLPRPASTLQAAPEPVAEDADARGAIGHPRTPGGVS